MNILVVGLGLIGASVAKALGSKHCVWGMEQNPQVLETALAEGTIVKKTETLGGFDVIFLCLYPRDVVNFTKEHGAEISPGTLVTEVCGIKGNLCQDMQALATAHGFSYIGGHPMAGKEASGYFASDPGIFIGASYIITAKENTPGAAVLAQLAQEMHFGRVVYADPKEHDGMVAFTSQLPHALACAYVLSPRCPKQAGFSAGSYRDVSRVAKINEALWSGLFLANQEFLLEELDALCGNLAQLRGLLAKGDAPALCAWLARARQVKEENP